MLRIKKSVVIFIMSATMVATAATLLWQEGGEAYESSLPVEKFIIEKKSGGSHSFDLELAEKPIDLQVGLMYRKEMPADHGMIFMMGRPPRPTSFWMKNTLIPLDMLFVDEKGIIVNIHRNATPESLTGVPSQKPVIAVIELNGGRADETGLGIGDKVLHPYFGTK